MSRSEAASLSRTLGTARPAYGRALLATLLGAAAIGADIGLIGSAAWLISKAAQRPNESELALAIVAVQFFGLSRAFARYGERLVGHDAAFRLLADLRVRVYHSLERLAPSGLPAFRRGDLLTRIVGDVDALQDIIIRVIPVFGAAILVGALTVTLMWWLLPAAGLILATALVLGGAVIPWLTGTLARRREARFAVLRADLASAVVDLTDGAAELIAFGAAQDQLAIIRARDTQLTAVTAASANTAGIGLALTSLLSSLACVGCLVAGIPAVAAGRLDGTTLAVITLIPLAALEIVVGLPVASQSLQRVRQSAARVFAVLDAPDPVVDPEPIAPLPTQRLDVQARSLDATYPGSATTALRGLDLDLPLGRRVAVVGASGAGKSTLAAVLLRFLAYRHGSVTLGGTSIDRLGGDDVRTVIGLVSQDAYLFDATIAQNLRIGERGASDGELREALDRVGLTSWIESLPRGLGTLVGAHGARLSGGQRQRVAMARALLANFPILVLDEPAEHLDPAAADALTADFLDIATDRTLMLITHRLARLESFDEILVIDAGAVLERGSHRRLLDDGGRYARLWHDEMRTRRDSSHLAENWSTHA